VVPDPAQHPWPGISTCGTHAWASTPFTACPGRFDHGKPTWRFAEWFRKAFNIEISCQGTRAQHTIMQERLLDVASVCADTDKQGFSACAISPERHVLMANQRIREIVAGNDIPGAAIYNTIEPSGNMGPFQQAAPGAGMANGGYFVTQNTLATPALAGSGAASGTLGGWRYTPARHPLVAEAFGGLQSPDEAKWYKFKRPLVIQNNTPIKIKLTQIQSEGTASRFATAAQAGVPFNRSVARAIKEGLLQTCFSEIPFPASAGMTTANACRRQLCDLNYTWYTRACMTYLPSVFSREAPIT
jgi:hypothetical protein